MSFQNNRESDVMDGNRRQTKNYNNRSGNTSGNDYQSEPQPQIDLKRALKEFVADFDSKEAEITSKFPSTVDMKFKSFRATVINAMQKTPKLFTCNQITIWSAIYAAAEDGLYPDGKLGFLNHYRDTEKGYVVCQWMPMLADIRQRCAEHGILINAQVVHKNDPWERHEGDNPRIVHGPIPWERGEMIGCYAIIRKGDEILHREVMTADQVAKAKEKSKAKNSAMWRDFTEEAWRKTVVRRASKTVSSLPRELVRIIERDDAHINFSLTDKVPANNDNTQTATAPAPAADARPTPPGDVMAPKSDPRPSMEPEAFTKYIEGFMVRTKKLGNIISCWSKATTAREWAGLSQDQKQRCSFAYSSALERHQDQDEAAANDALLKLRTAA